MSTVWASGSKWIEVFLHRSFVDRPRRMSTLDLKAMIHRMVDSTQNESLLRSLLNLLEFQTENDRLDGWSALTDVQRAELLLAFGESDDPKNLVPNDEVFKKYGDRP